MTQSNSGIKFLDHPDGRLAYRDEGHGETIVFVHGTPTSSKVPFARQVSVTAFFRSRILCWTSIFRAGT